MTSMPSNQTSQPRPQAPWTPGGQGRRAKASASSPARGGGARDAQPGPVASNPPSPHQHGALPVVLNKAHIMGARVDAQRLCIHPMEVSAAGTGSRLGGKSERKQRAPSSLAASSPA